MTVIDRRLFVFGLCSVGLAGMPVGRINSVFAATKISPDERSVLIVVDVQNCFLSGGSLAVKDGEQVIPVINRIASPDFSHNKVHRGDESAKVVVPQRFPLIRGAPRCKQTVAQICSDLHSSKDAKSWQHSMAGR